MFPWIQKEGASQVALEPAANSGAISTCRLPGSGRSPGGSHGNPLQNSCLGNPMDRGAWQAACQWVPKSQTPLKRLSMQAGAHSKGKRDDAVCTVGGLGCLVLLMPRQYCQMCPGFTTAPQSTQDTSTHRSCVWNL